MGKLFLMFIFLSAFVNCGGNKPLEYETDTDFETCTEDSEEVISENCGPNNEGTKYKKCINGEWVFNDDYCILPETQDTSDKKINLCENITCPSFSICNNETGICNCKTGYEFVDKKECKSICGDNIVVEGEECDGSTIEKTCQTFGYSTGNLSCKNTCEYNKNDCRITKQWGTTSEDNGNSVSVDSSGNVFVIGDTNGGLDGNKNLGGLDGNKILNGDIFLTKFDNTGNKLFTKQWGTTSYDAGKSVAVDSSGNVFVIGYISGGLDGNKNKGGNDIFLTKFDNDGNKLFTKQWGTTSNDEGKSVAVDSLGNVFVTGQTQGGLDGNTNDCTSNCYSSNDIFLTKFDNDGNKKWTKQWGTSGSDYGNSVAVDSSENVFVTGSTWRGLDGNTNSGGYEDIFLTKFDNNGNKLWTKQWGTVNSDIGESVTVDNSGNVFVTGYTTGGFDGNTNEGSWWDVLLIKIDNAGNKLWTKQWGTTYNDIRKSVAVDSSGEIFITGSTHGGLDGNTNTRYGDIFLIKLNGNE